MDELLVCISANYANPFWFNFDFVLNTNPSLMEFFKVLVWGITTQAYYNKISKLSVAYLKI